MTAYDIPSIRRTPKLEIEPQRLAAMLSGTRKIFIAVPTEAGEVKVDTMNLVLDGHIDALIQGWAFDVRYNRSRPISTCRNILLAQFLASDCDDLMWIDHDVNTQPGQMAKLIAARPDFVGAVPPFRGDPLGFPVQWKLGHIVMDPETGLVEVQGIPFGFVRMRRVVAERMVAGYPDLEYDHPGCPNDVAWDLFDFARYDRSKWSEDMTFCRRWREIGGQVWIDPKVKFAHTGEKAFFGSLYDFMVARPSFEEEHAAYREGDEGATEAAGTDPVAA